MLRQNDLTKETVSNLVYSYKDNAVSEELNSFGLMLLAASQERARQINSTAVTILTWATGILAILITQLDVSATRIQLVILLFGSASSLVAVIYSFLALRIRDEWLWPSDKDWFQKTALVSKDELMRFHIRSIHEVKQAKELITERKGLFLFRAQQFLMSGAFLLATGIAAKLILGFVRLSTVP